MSRPFLDTNILLYAALQPDPRSETARGLLARGGLVSVQVLNEFTAVARRKLRRPWPEVRQALAAIRTLCPAAPRPLTVATHDAAIGLAERLGYTIDDALILASALEAGCDTLFSEDLQDGQVVEGQLTIRNPFAAP
ncbi:pilus assembly protein (plasmid) [Roseomonas gilardii]|uniref:Pilus assembly protein n=1 Tax=Roseomonas gilardii TaxID=257708 RepID=A0A1L7ANW3_9PROT|nr:PIN domain-containing protein [Roseomonas gilardii]APT60404.1 pilus assembly protein [Roseomonas gilardii]